ncbi:YIP1 family protein [Leptolyngbya ohadii]|uniref:YIP1 family protein n=1 Tax=Leptolyngbya ohadii TaxID=1962290 RepID=UPI000B59DD22|nr:YIP1 family protein [Leptolyngbya ohadii]
MNSAFHPLGEFIRGAIVLNPETFRAIESLPNADQIAFSVLLLAGLSQAIGQSIILFINRVKPLRFLLTLLIAAILFVFSYGFWVMSVWLVDRIVFGHTVSYSTISHALGLAAAPQILSFLIALPYFGVPIQVVLSLWSLLAFVRGFAAVTDVDAWQAFWCGILGWFVLQVMQRTIGRPIAALGQWLKVSTAGTNLVTDLPGLERLLETGLSESRLPSERNSQ